MAEELAMRALEVVWLSPDYRYSYYADEDFDDWPQPMPGRGRIKLTLRSQLRPLNRVIAGWYRRWQARSLLRELYGNIVYKLDPEGMTIRS